uniref:Uncharacterized protein n=1 Tax=Vespula pensylvanica TaxID=30213 RepID=A0A834P2G1_VESPE|nr:hypothetical protein H0235_008095 [Vespula pensylvanica]
MIPMALTGHTLNTPVALAAAVTASAATATRKEGNPCGLRTLEYSIETVTLDIRPEARIRIRNPSIVRTQVQSSNVHAFVVESRDSDNNAFAAFIDPLKR